MRQEGLVMRAENDTHRLSIYQDDSPTSPRKWDNLGTMICFHPRYDLGDKHKFDNTEEWIRDLAQDLGIETEVQDEDGDWDYRNPVDIFTDVKKQAIILPLYLYDHSGLRMSTGSFCDPWDSGQVGWMYCTHDKVKEEYGNVTEETINTAKEVMTGEVETFDQYLIGDIYGFVFEEIKKCECCGHIEYEIIDSCWGFYGRDVKENGIADNISTEYQDLIDNLKSV